ncbi:MAG: MFS transporter, partial [Burkholderiales bacterium]|nr:MFS transporter [Burkholderiales bacterium]
MRGIKLKILTGKSVFWVGYSVSILGRFIHGMALSWIVWAQTRSPLWLSAIALLSALPSLPLAPLAGQVADRFHRHRILLVTQTLGCSVATLTAIFAWTGWLNPYLLAVLSLCFGIITSMDGPSLHSMLVESGETVSEAVARQSLIMNIARSVAPMIAVGIIEAVGAGFCFFVNAIAFLPMIYIMAVVRIPNRTTEKEREQSKYMTSRELFIKYQVLKDVLPQVGCLSIFIMPAVALLPAISLKGSELMSFGS